MFTGLQFLIERRVLNRFLANLSLNLLTRQLLH